MDQVMAREVDNHVSPAARSAFARPSFGAFHRQDPLTGGARRPGAVTARVRHALLVRGWRPRTRSAVVI